MFLLLLFYYAFSVTILIRMPSNVVLYSIGCMWRILLRITRHLVLIMCRYFLLFLQPFCIHDNRWPRTIFAVYLCIFYFRQCIVMHRGARRFDYTVALSPATGCAFVASNCNSQHIKLWKSEIRQFRGNYISLFSQLRATLLCQQQGLMPVER